MKHLVCLIFVVLFWLPVYAEELDGRASLQQGKKELESGKCEDAIVSLKAAEKHLPVLGDYALLWISGAHHEIGNHVESLKTLRTLLKTYPHSSLTKKARASEITEACEVADENIRQLFESYIRDYSGDIEMKYVYAQWLKNNGRQDQAKSIFKDIYIDADLFSVAAYAELSPSDICIEDIVKRASNLVRHSAYKDAESSLRDAMGKDDGTLRKDILKELGLTLFKQKKYREAAETYQKLGERYWELRSYYRAGAKDIIDEALEDLLKSGDKRFGSILNALAADRRRDGNVDEALRIYQVVSDRFPRDSEDASWGIGWTYFLSSEYEKSAEVFSRLYTTYKDPKYLYWKNRSLEADGKVTLSNYAVNPGKGRDFYSVMGYLRNGNSGGQTGVTETQDFMRPDISVTADPFVYKKNERIETLIELGFSQEALAEMVYVSKNTVSLEDIFYLCAKFQEMGEYSNVVRTAAKAPYSDELHRFLYPLAYRGTVERLAKKYSIDSLLVFSIMREESRFDSSAKSPAGAFGLMQLMPRTASRIDRNLKLGIKCSRDLFESEKNIHIGIYYLSRLVEEFGSYPYAIAAYNAGEEAVRRWLQKGKYRSTDEFIEDIPYLETRNYVKRVITTFFEYKRAQATDGKMMQVTLEKL